MNLKAVLHNNFVILLVFGVSMTLTPILGQNQGDNPEVGGQQKKRASGSAMLLDEEITSLHKRLAVSMRKFNKYYDYQREELFIARGISNRMGVQENHSYEEVVYIKYSGDTITSLRFVYNEIDMQSLLQETRILTNESVGGDLGGLTLEYLAGSEENPASQKKFRVKDLVKEDKKLDVLRMYRAYIYKTLRYLETEIARRVTAQGYEIDAIINLGNGNPK